MPSELNYQESPTESREFGRIIRRIILSAAQPRGGAALEFLLALATKRLKLRPSDAADVLDATMKGNVLLTAFATMARTAIES